MEGRCDDSKALERRKKEHMRQTMMDLQHRFPKCRRNATYGRKRSRRISPILFDIRLALSALFSGSVSSLNELGAKARDEIDKGRQVSER